MGGGASLNVTLQLRLAPETKGGLGVKYAFFSGSHPTRTFVLLAKEITAIV